MTALKLTNIMKSALSKSRNFTSYDSKEKATGQPYD